MGTNEELTDLFFTKELSESMRKLFIDFLIQYQGEIPKDVKINLSLTVRYGKDGYEIEFDPNITTRRATELEVRGAPITDADWDYIFNPDNFHTPFTREFERLDRFYSSLQKLREAGNTPIGGLDWSGINPAFIRFDSPYRIVEAKEEYRYDKSWTRTRFEIRYLPTGKHYLARLW